MDRCVLLALYPSAPHPTHTHLVQSNLRISISIAVALAGQQSFQLLGIATRLASGHSQHAQCAAGMWAAASSGRGKNIHTVHNKYIHTYIHICICVNVVHMQLICIFPFNCNLCVFNLCIQSTLILNFYFIYCISL